MTLPDRLETARQLAQLRLLPTTNLPLRTSWHGIDGVFVDITFAQPGPWSRKCIKEASHGVQIILIAPSATHEEWYHQTFTAARVALLWRGRLARYPRLPSTIFCFGDQRFAAQFRKTFQGAGVFLSGV